MKLLKIENNKGYFFKADDYEEIHNIDKEQILNLVNLSLGDEAEFDEFVDENLPNKAQNVIYENVYNKLKNLNERKDEFEDKSKRYFLDEYEKYKPNVNPIE